MKEIGEMNNPIIDSQMSVEEALIPNPNFEISSEIFKKQILLNVIYLSFDNKYHQGQIVVHPDLELDVKELFEMMLEIKFPIFSVIPIVDKKFNFSDTLSMDANNSLGFNPRCIAGTQRLSNHASGRAIDINPMQNPYIKGGIVEPVAAVYNIKETGTILADSPVVTFLKSRDWKWGGEYIELKDYQHFENENTAP